MHHVYISLLKLCKEKKSLRHVHHVLTHLAAYQWDLVQLFGDFVVFILAKCGGLEDALHVSNNLVCRTVFSWTSIIAGYTECGRDLEALRMHCCMLEDGVEPDRYTFVSLLKACGTVPDIEEGRKLHADAQEKGLTLDVYVGSTLVSMYGKCGNTVEAEWVFCGLSQRNIVTWNAMLSAYVEQGQGEKALLLYRQMREAGESPTELTFVSAVQASNIFAGKGESSAAEGGQSRKSMTLEFCQALHADARKEKVDSYVNLGNTLVNMYGKYGSIGEAQNLFFHMPQRDVVSWNALLLAYVDQEQGVKGLQVYAQLHLENVSPDQHTFAIALQACCTLVLDDEANFADTQPTRKIFLEIGQVLHADAERKGFSSDSFVVSMLVSLYGKCGLIKEAENLFLRLFDRDVVLWSSMISAFVEQGCGDRAIQTYRQMQAEGLSADDGILIVVLQACGALVDVEESADWQTNSALISCKDICRALHAEAHRKGLTSASVLNTLIAVYGKCGMLAEAEHVFNSLRQQNIVSWNALLSAYVENGEVDKALLLYKVLLEGNVSPDGLTYLIIFQACSIFAEREDTAVVGEQTIKLASFAIGQALYMEAKGKGFVSHVFIHNTLVHMYSKCGNLAEALKVFNALPQQGVVAWNAIISVFLEQGQGDKALQLYKQMQVNGVGVNKATLVRVLQACNETSNLEMCKQIHFCISAVGCDLTSSVANTLIHTYGGCALIADALAVFDGKYEPCVVSWNACLAGYACQGNCTQYLEMQLMGVDPNEVTFLSFITACSHAGYVHEGIDYFKCMPKHFSLDPDNNHYAVMIDLFGRAGDFKHLECFMQKSSMEIDISMWSRLLGACRTHSNVDLGKWAFDHAVSLCPEKATSYVWMSNIYAAAAVEESMGENENLKERGGPWSLNRSVLVKSDIKESVGEAEDLRERGGSWGLGSSILVKSDINPHCFTVENQTLSQDKLLYDSV